MKRCEKEESVFIFLCTITINILVLVLDGDSEHVANELMKKRSIRREKTSVL